MEPFDQNRVIRLDVELNGGTPEAFGKQFAEAISKTKEFIGVVYVLNAQRPIPRLRGSSTVLYIGKTEHSLFDRYPKWNIRADTENYWTRYAHIISNYGAITIDVYDVVEPKVSENDFLFAYHQEYFEAPPLNTNNWRHSLLSTEQTNAWEAGWKG